MKKKCMAVGGTAKKPASMEEQLAGIRGKVRPGYQAGGIAGQVDDLMNRTNAMPNSIASAPQPYGGSTRRSCGRLCTRARRGRRASLRLQ